MSNLQRWLHSSVWNRVEQDADGPFVLHADAEAALRAATERAEQAEADRDLAYQRIGEVALALANEPGGSVLECVNGLIERAEQAEKDLADLLTGSLTIESLMVRNGKADLQLGGEVVAGLGNIMAEWYEQNGGPNYCEVQLSGKGRSYTLTIQRSDGKTPHALRLEAEARAEQAERLAGEREALLREAVDDLQSWGAYASDYFADKHDLAGTLARYRAALATGAEHG